MIIASEDLENEGSEGNDEDDNPPSPSTTDIRNYMKTASKPASIDEVI